MKNTNEVLKISSKDNVVVALKDLKKGMEINDIVCKEDIPRGHKMALVHIAENENVIKYGFPIGHATKDIQQGEHIHTHNMKTNLKGIVDYQYEPALHEVKPTKKSTFKGFLRANGKVGIRNEIWVVNTVGCVNKPAEKIVELANKKFAGRTDGIFTFVHPFGCSQLGDDHVKTQKILAAMVNHPNAAGVLVFGLGCENNNIKEFKKVLGEYDENRVKFLIAQETNDEIESGLALIEELVCYAEKQKRQDISVDELVIGLKCGGSDGFSGITANPLVGRISDYLVEHGGTTILSEVPEMFGAETILMNRCQSKDLFDQTVSLINDFKDYFVRHNQEVYENPSPGNKDGGISTLEDKSLGCTQKGGSSNVTAVLAYGEPVHTKGLNLLEGPGNDIVAITALMASGAHMVLFTTGRGTPVGAPIPTLKISTNTALSESKGKWIDFNAGVLLEGVSMETATDSLWNLVLEIASGQKQAKNEENGYREISIFKDGVTL